MTNGNGVKEEKIQVSLTLDLPKETFEILDKLKVEYGVKTRGRVIELLLQDLLAPEE